MVPGDLLDMGLEPKRREPKRRATHVVGIPIGTNLYRHYDLKYTIDLYCGLKFRHAVGCLICAVGLKLPVMYGGMYGASYILYGAAHTCMVRAVLVRAYSA